LCPHGKADRGYYCKECPGKGICEHGRERRKCKECGGSGLCEHGRQPSRCKECGGSGICEHGRVRYGCKTCARLSRIRARDAKPPLEAKVEIKQEFDDVEDPGEEDYSLQ
jgi:DnaJ-class molecular chaperone